jgi:hypothetical protein
VHVNFTDGPLVPIEDSLRETLSGLYRDVEEFCGVYDLPASKDLCIKLIHILSHKETSTGQWLSAPATSLGDTLISELKSKKFLHIRPDIVRYFETANLFGDTVADRFPSASIDIEEAGKCFATQRFTASVMHCMRVLEHGLCALCLTLELPFGEKSWQRSLQAIEARIAVFDSQVNPKRKAAWKQKRQFYAEAVAEFTHFKDAWRNHAAHGREHYDEERAEKIISHTRSFMQVLATRLKEKR